MFRDAPYQTVNETCRSIRCPLRAFYDERRRQMSYPPRLIGCVARDHQMEAGEILAKNNSAEMVALRRLCVAVIKAYRLGISTSSLAMHLNRDHTTILHMVGGTNRSRRLLEERWNR